MLYPLSYTGVIPVAGFEPATTRLQGEVTVVFTTGQSYRRGTFEKSDSGRGISRYLALRGYAPVPGTLIPGRAAGPARRGWQAKYPFSFTTGERR